MLRCSKHVSEVVDIHDAPGDGAMSPSTSTRAGANTPMHDPAAERNVRGAIDLENCHDFHIAAFNPLQHRPRTSVVQDRVNDGGAKSGYAHLGRKHMPFETLNNPICDLLRRVRSDSLAKFVKVLNGTLF